MAQLSLPPSFTASLTPLQVRLRDINAFQLPRLTASSSSSNNNDSVGFTAETLSAYETELNDALDECSTLIEQGQWLVTDLLDAAELDQKVQEILVTEWDRAKSGYTAARIASRSALLSARKTLAQRKKAGPGPTRPTASSQDNTATTTSSSSVGPHQSVRQQQKRQTQQHTGDDAALLASSELTSSLQNALGLLSDSLSQSTLSTSLLEESTSTLNTLSFSYTSFTDLLKNSSGILKSMQSQDRWDALMLLGAYAFFALCVAYILKVRIWDRSLKVLMILLRLGGIRTGGGDVKNKIALAKEAAKSEAASNAVTKVVETIAGAVVTTTATSAAAVVSAPNPEVPVSSERQQPASEQAEPITPSILDQVQEILDEQHEEADGPQVQQAQHGGGGGEGDDARDNDDDENDIDADEFHDAPAQPNTQHETTHDEL